VAAPRAGRAQRRQRAAARDQPSVLRRPHDRIPPGIPYALQMLEDVGTAVGNRDEETAFRRSADRCDRFGPDRRLAGRPRDAFGRPRPDRLVGKAQGLARGQDRQAAVRQEPTAAIVADPAGALEPTMRREIEGCVVVHHEHDRMPRCRSTALSQMRLHDCLSGDCPAVELPIRGFGFPDRAELSRQTRVGSPGDRGHGAHKTIGSSCVAQVGRPEPRRGPMIDVIQHYRPLALLAADAESTSNRRMLAVKENVDKSQL